MNLTGVMQAGISVSRYLHEGIKGVVPGAEGQRQHDRVPGVKTRKPYRSPSVPWTQVGFEQRFGIGEDPHEIALMLPERELWLEKSFFEDADHGVTFHESRVDGRWEEGESFR